MANGYSTAGSTISAISPALSAVPYVGSILSLAGTVAGGLLQKKGAEEQAAQAKKTREDALNLKTDAIRPEYLKKLNMDKMAYLSDAPGTGFAKAQLEAQTANQLRAIRESSPNGALTVNAISAALGARNTDEQNLAIRNAAYKADKANTVGNDLAMLGDKGMELENRRDAWKRQDLQAASALENAATANKMTAANTIIGGLTSTGVGLGKIAQDQQFVNALNSAYGSNTGANATQPTTTTPLINSATNGGSALMGTNSNYSFGPTEQQRLSGLLSAGAGSINADDRAFLTDALQQLAISGRQEDAVLAKQIRSILNQ